MFEANKECYNNTEGHPLVSVTGGHGGGGGGGQCPTPLGPISSNFLFALGRVFQIYRTL